MKQLEDQLKDAFDHFEPEVDPSVWANVSSQIAAPLTPANDGGSSVASTVSKGVLSKLAPFAGWISGAAILIIGGALLWKMNQNADEAKQTNPPEEVITKTEAPAALLIQTETTSVPVEKTASENEKGKTAAANRNQESAKDLSSNGDINSVPVQNTSGNTDNSEKEKANTGSVKNEEVIQKSKNAESHVTAEQPSQKADNSINNNSNAPAPEASTEKTAKAILILNTKGGFAPLTVTVITNQENKLAEFDFGDGTQQSQTSAATHKFEEPGNYTIHCKVNNTELEATVVVLDKVVSAFSPNGDGINDFFTISDTQVSAIEISIFDRSGKKIFSSKGRQISWDGKISGDKIAETGTYFYNIFVTSQNGSVYKQKGTINLFR